jgi:hypothetical protein
MNVLLNAYIKGGTSTGGPLDINGTTNSGAGFDTTVLGGLGEVAAIVTIGNIAANMTALKIQHSNNNSDWDDLSGSSFSGTALPTAGDGDNKQWLFHFRTGGSLRRYLRVVGTGGAGATLYGVVWIGLHGAKGVTGTDEIQRSASQNLGNTTSLIGRTTFPTTA